jgi:DNA polymerase-3 subunit alpha
MYLNCKTYFSFCYGTFSTRELVTMASTQGVTALALTNINNTCDAWDFVQYCREEHIKPVVGVEVRNGDNLLYILLAANNAGFAWINEFLSLHLLTKLDFPVSPAKGFFAKPEDGFAIYAQGTKPVEKLLPNERIGLLPEEVNKLYNIDMKLHGDKVVIRQPVTVQDKTHHSLHRLLRAIDKNVLLSMLLKQSQCAPTETFVAPTALLHVFKQYPAVVMNTYRVLEACNIEMDFKVDKNKQSVGPSVEDDRILLEKLAQDGLKQRYDANNKVAAERLQKELGIISDMGFNSYFLINYDIVRYAQSKGFYYVGRGSGANSIVAYCLRITDVDPIELNLYFERFLNPERTSPPDFDIDFSYTDRDEVMDYVFKRYGRKHVALLGAYPTFQHDGTIRQLGKVFGLPGEEIDALQLSNYAQDDIQALVLKYGKLMKNFPVNPSLHPCGMLISELPITNYAALFMPPKNMPTALIDMFVAENIGLNKFDILSQRGLGHIRESLSLIKQNRGVDVNIHDFKNFRQDERVKQQIRTANTIGCFYIESPAMRQLLGKLRCDDYPTLVAASSIIRPGVAQSGMMREYITRYHHREKIVYLHPLFEEHLSETFGVMVFQEDVIKIGHYFAGLTLAEADILRRAMSGKYRSSNQFQAVKDKFFANCKVMGHPDALAAEVWRQIESFAGYSFNKAHSASFAVESYMSLYLKTYYPREFMVAVINNFGGFYSTELYFMELLKTGVDLQPPCVNKSDVFTNINKEQVYVGFTHIKRLQDKLVTKLLEERKLRGPFKQLQDFIERTGAGIEQLNTLISIGAFRFTGKSKKTLLWEANFLQKKSPPGVQAPVLFKDKPLEFKLPELVDKRIDDLYDQQELLGFMLSNPFELADDDPEQYHYAKDLAAHDGKIVTMLVYFIARKQVQTKNNTEMFFGSFVDANLDWVDTVHFPEVARRYPLHSSGFYRITGRVVNDFGVYSVEVSMMTKVGHKKRTYDNL